MSQFKKLYRVSLDHENGEYKFNIYSSTYELTEFVNVPMIAWSDTKATDFVPVDNVNVVLENYCYTDNLERLEELKIVILKKLIDESTENIRFFQKKRAELIMKFIETRKEQL